MVNHLKNSLEPEVDVMVVCLLIGSPRGLTQTNNWKILLIGFKRAKMLITLTNLSKRQPLNLALIYVLAGYHLMLVMKANFSKNGKNQSSTCIRLPTVIFYFKSFYQMPNNVSKLISRRKKTWTPVMLVSKIFQQLNQIFEVKIFHLVSNKMF